MPHPDLVQGERADPAEPEAQHDDVGVPRRKGADGAQHSRTAWRCAGSNLAAFDANILGIRPDLVVQIRRDLLGEIDGPMLRHGLQDRHGERLRVLPRSRRERPATDLLEQRYERFASAG